MNNELKLNVDKQQHDIKHLKEQCDIDDEDEVKEITAATTPMKKNKHMCVCDMLSNICNNKLVQKICPGRAHDPV